MNSKLTVWYAMVAMWVHLMIFECVWVSGEYDDQKINYCWTKN